MNPGTLVDGKYRIDRQLGEGGMAIVYAATHVALNDRVAIKVLMASLAGNPTVVERFMREARAAVRLKSEHVVRVMDVGTLPTQQPYIVMEFLDGQDLEGLLKSRGTLPFSEVVDYTIQVCEALAEAHAAGIVHRDIKPANCVLANRTDGTQSIKVLDFGIAKLTLGDDAAKLTATSATMGTPAFMSPEQIKGAKDVDHRGDIWSLGIAMFQLIVGRVPFLADTYGRLVLAVMKEPTPPMPDVPPGLEAVIGRCLAKDRAHRYQTIGELAEALVPFAGDQGTARVLAQRAASLGRTQVGRATPAPSAPAPAAPGYATPPGGNQPYATPGHGNPPYATPGHGNPPYATPGHGIPPYATPGYGNPPYATPGYGNPPYATPGYGNPPYATPAHGNQPQPGYGQPHMATGPQPYAQPPQPYAQPPQQPYAQQPPQQPYSQPPHHQPPPTPQTAPGTVPPPRSRALLFVVIGLIVGAIAGASVLLAG